MASVTFFKITASQQAVLLPAVIIRRGKLNLSLKHDQVSLNRELGEGSSNKWYGRSKGSEAENTMLFWCGWTDGLCGRL